MESELYSYKETIKEISNLRNEIMSGNNQADENTGAGSNSVRVPGQPTEMIATRLLTHRTLRNLEEVATAITDVYKMVSDDHRKVIEVKYFSGKRLDWNDVSIQCNMHRNTALKLRGEVIRLLANKLGLR